MRRREMAQGAAYWVPLVRGIFAIILGLALIIQPEKTRPMLVNFMGIYWLGSGIVSIRWGASGERARGLPVVAGIVGVLAGLVVITRNLLFGLASETIVLYLLGIVILLTGLLHTFGGFRKERGGSRQWSWGSLLLGIFEIVLGGMLIIAPLERGTAINWAASIWAVIGGLMLIGDARLGRARALRASRTDDTAV